MYDEVIKIDPNPAVSYINKGKPLIYDKELL